MLEYVAYNIVEKEALAIQRFYGHQIKILNTFLEQILNREVTQMELTSAQSHVIGYLAHSPEPPCARDLEEFFGLSHPTVSGMLSRMEAKGFIQLRPDDKDRRIKRIYLLEKGMACSVRTQEVIRDNEQLIVEGFTAEEIRQFDAFLDRAIENLGRKAHNAMPQREE